MLTVFNFSNLRAKQIHSKLYLGTTRKLNLQKPTWQTLSASTWLRPTGSTSPSKSGISTSVTRPHTFTTSSSLIGTTVVYGNAIKILSHFQTTTIMCEYSVAQCIVKTVRKFSNYSQCTAVGDRSQKICRVV